MLTRKSWPAQLPCGLVIVADDAAAAQCAGSAEPGPLGMIGRCASRACRFAAFASGARFVQSRAVSNDSNSVFTTGGIAQCARSERVERELGVLERTGHCMGERRTTQISRAPSLSPYIIPKPDPPASAAGAARV